ncbi:cell division protein FtsZ [Maribacter confluentis]|uniref:Cell division protein FtsZ n=2 Tax=Maribacter TaxID=252356 RepID=A0ABY1SKV9_9FLAO|nr:MULTISPECIES: cell division protein FtsZ [Maribacter]MDO1512002.1 cell division protein FtsZ [Maribacter confluentis]TVZ15266.1 cell division protein FtsZ [Maribacter sp. MAR_2009_72]SNR72386.1 cell division protein FtsZ [Maribacter sedimenticola]
MSKNSEFDNISFDLPKNQSNVIKVIGVGGGGSNAINHMFQAGINGVDFVICNTDSQALDNSPVPNKIQLGVSLTEGLGAGANPEVGEQAAMESMEEIKGMLDSTTKMIFITAGMGGGTGTGAAPVIAKFAKEMDVLTVGIVTMPFQFEGKMRVDQAHRGIEKLRKNVDSLIVINNNKLREVYGNLGFKAGFSKADEVLATAARGIAEVITHHYTQNIDLRDAKTVLSNSGTAIMGSAIASGSARANEAIMKALDSPLLNDNKIQGAKNVLLLIVSGAQEITIDEIGEINDHIQIEAGYGANIIMGVGEDESLGEAIAVTVIATGFNIEQQDDIVNTESKKIIHTLEDGQRAEAMLLSNTKTVHTLEMDEEEEEVKPVSKYQFVDEAEFDLIPTTNYIKNFNVFYEEVVAENVSEDDFVIVDTAARNIEVVDPEVLKARDHDEEIAFNFDMPSREEEKENVITFNLNDEVKDLDVKDSIEIIPVLEYNKNGEKRYSLDDYMKLESKLTGAKSKAEEFEPKIVEDELIFEKRTVAPVREERPTDAPLDPMETPIEELLRERADDRRRKLKDYNYNFKNTKPSSYDENKPAYQRQGIHLNDAPREKKISRTSLSDDSNDEIQLRSNNSFLHDNVD